jgi:hypothetical protein
MSKKQKRILWPVLMVIAIGVGGLVFANTRSRSDLPSARVNGSLQPKADRTSASEADVVKDVSSSLPQSEAPRGAEQVVRFTVYDVGIFPREAHASPGWVVIHIEDMSGSSAGLVVQSESRQTLGQIVRGQRHWRGHGRVRLEPGRYRVFDATRPESQATLIVDAQ